MVKFSWNFFLATSAVIWLFQLKKSNIDSYQGLSMVWVLNLFSIEGAMLQLLLLVLLHLCCSLSIRSAAKEMWKYSESESGEKLLFLPQLRSRRRIKRLKSISDAQCIHLHLSLLRERFFFNIFMKCFFHFHVNLGLFRFWRNVVFSLW